MAVWEVLVLDGLTLTGDPTGALVLEKLAAPPPKERQDWVTAADSEAAALSRSPLHENREITLRVRVGQQATMDLALNQVGALRDKLRKASLTEAGIAMTWTPAGATRTVTFDVLAGEITDIPITWDGDDTGWFANRPVMNVTLTAKPYWRGSEVLTSTASSSTPIATIEVANVPGDVPALGRLIVTDTATQTRRHVEWGLENKHYNSGTSLIIDSDSLVTTGFAGTGNTRTGAYDPGAAGNSIVRGNIYQAAGGTVICGTGNQTHVGVFRVIARVWTVAGTDMRVWFSWQVGDGPFRSNAWAIPPTDSQWVSVDLGTIYVPPVTAGTQRWTGRVNATYAAAGSQFIDVDYLLLVPQEDGYGKALAPTPNSPTAGATGTVGFDDFTSTTGGSALNARVAPLGGTWATSGATSDFAFVDDGLGGELISRSSINDTGSGRHAILGATSYTNVTTTVRVQRTAVVTGGGTFRAATTARWVDASNFIAAGIGTTIGTDDTFRVQVVVAGVQVSGGLVKLSLPLSVTYTIYLTVYASGVWVATLLGAGFQILATLYGSDPALATGGALATGKAGVIDTNTSAFTVFRYYDDVGILTPDTEPVVVNSTRSVEFRHDATVRVDSAGTYYGPPPAYRGARFLVPPGTSRVAVKARRFNVDQATEDNVTDATQIQVGYTPRGLVVPR